MGRFLREMGGIFAFVGNQYRLEVDGQEFFIDILLYHRHLKCLVAVELKVGDFLPEYIGKMQFYLAALDSLVKTPCCWRRAWGGEPLSRRSLDRHGHAAGRCKALAW